MVHGADESLDRPSDPLRLFEAIYPHLRRLAEHYFATERAGHTLQPTALVHEAYQRLADDPAFAGRGQDCYFAAAARAMRQILVDHARARNAQSRGAGWRRVTIVKLETGLHAVPDDLHAGVDVEALDTALTRLSRLGQSGARQARLVELLYFAGCSQEDAARILELSPRTVGKDWAMARAWLRRALS